VLAALEDGDNELPMVLRHTLSEMLEQLARLTLAMAAIEQRLEDFAQRDLASQQYQRVPGIGVLTATALRASAGALDRFRSGRHFAAWLGLTPREHSSGTQRRLGRISKRGDSYLRLLLIHGARAALRAAHLREQRQQPLTRLQLWALAAQQRIGHNKAAVALANKTARRLWAMQHHGTDFDGNHCSSRRDATKPSL
jgi:transposase